VKKGKSEMPRESTARKPASLLFRRAISLRFRRCVADHFITHHHTSSDCHSSQTMSSDMEVTRTSRESPPFIFTDRISCGDIPQDVTHIEVASSITEIPAAIFNNREDLRMVELSDRLRIIRQSAFSHCRPSLKHINIPSTVSEICDHAFEDSGLITLQLPEGLVVVGSRAFFRCAALSRISIPASIKTFGESVFSTCHGLVTVELSEGLELIGGYAFCDCVSLSDINFPSSLKEIRRGAFSGCGKIRSLILPEGLRVLGCLCFAGSGLQRLKSPSTLKEIPESAFATCTGLVDLNLSEGLQVVGATAFMGCISLYHVKLPSTVKVICAGAFQHCLKLVSVEVPESLGVIRNYAFHGCDVLSNFFIPPSVYEVGEDGFVDNKGLSSGRKSLLQGLFSDEDNSRHITKALQTRFDGFPAHRLCYFQAQYPALRTLITLKQLLQSDATAVARLDRFGMTPFHILSLSGKLNITVFEDFMQACPVEVVNRRDKFGYTPLHYLCQNQQPNSLTIAKALIRHIIGCRLKFLGLDQWKIEILNAIDAVSVIWTTEEKIEALRKVYAKLLPRYERMEALSQMELILWKIKIDDETISTRSNNSNGEREGNFHKRLKVDEEKSAESSLVNQNHLRMKRNRCRVNCGASIVISNVLKFLGPLF
jgi:hypothetical protein